MKVLIDNKPTDVKLVVCHSNITLKKDKENKPIPLNPIEVKKGYTFVFLTEVGFCYLSEQSKWDLFKNEDNIIKLLSTDEKNNVFASGTNASGKRIKYNGYKVMYTEGMDMPDHDIEFPALIDDIEGIYRLPLDRRFTEQTIKMSWISLTSQLKEEEGFNYLKPPQRKSDEIAFSKRATDNIKNYIEFKKETEKNLGKISSSYYLSTEAKTSYDFMRKYHKEVKKVKGDLIRSERSLKKMMDKKSKFYVPPGIYIIAGCRNIGFEEEPTVSNNGTRSRVAKRNNYNLNNYNLAKRLNDQAMRVLDVEKMSEVGEKRKGRNFNNNQM